MLYVFIGRIPSAVQTVNGIFQDHCPSNQSFHLRHLEETKRSIIDHFLDRSFYHHYIDPTPKRLQTKVSFKSLCDIWKFDLHRIRNVSIDADRLWTIQSERQTPVNDQTEILEDLLLPVIDVLESWLSQEATFTPMRVINNQTDIRLDDEKKRSSPSNATRWLLSDDNDSDLDHHHDRWYTGLSQYEGLTVSYSKPMPMIITFISLLDLHSPCPTMPIT